MTTKKNQNKKLEKILVIDDSVDEVLKLTKALPESLSVDVASQFEASFIQKFNYDLIILDNDANNTKSSKGKNTLKTILRQNSKIPIIYTSFLPGGVSGEIYQEPNVKVVKTNELLNYLSNNFGLEMKKESEEKKAGKTSLIVTYNDVAGYSPGIYDNGKLIIISNIGRAFENAPEIVKGQLNKIYDTFDFRADKDKIKKVYVYVGLHDIAGPLRMASSIAHDMHQNEKMILMACSCEWNKKVDAARIYDFKLNQVNCGGQYALGKIADKILGVKRIK